MDDTVDYSLRTEMQNIGGLKHAKNACLSPEYELAAYPNMERLIVDSASSMGFSLPDRRAVGHPVRPRTFELQTHQRSVARHKDDVDTGVFFGLMPVRSRCVIESKLFESRTLFSFRLGRQAVEKRMEPGRLIVFNPRTPHSLTYFGEETTFMLFTLVRSRKARRASEEVL